MSKLRAGKSLFWALVGVLLCALALRVWALNWGLPYLYDHDEASFVSVSQHIFKTGDLNPHDFDYGSFLFYINALAYIPYYLVGLVTGAFHSPNDIAYPEQLAMGSGITTMPGTFVLERSVTLLFGMAAVFMVFLLARRVSRNKYVGLLAAFMIAVSPTCVDYSRSISPNMFLVFFVLLAVWAAVRIYEDNSTGAYALAGIATGLVASTKYNGALVLGVVLLACLFREGWRGLKEPGLLLVLLLSAATFLITTPFAVLDYHTFVNYVRGQAIHYSTGHAGMEGDTIGWYFSFLWSQEGPVWVLGFIGALYAVLRRNKLLMIVASFPVGYGIFISGFIVRNDRTILPLLPFLYILAAVIVVDAVGWLLSRRVNRRLVLTLGAAVVALLLLYPAGQTAAYATQLTVTDSRVTGVQWIDKNIPHGSKVAIEVGAPYVDPRNYTVVPIGEIILYSPDWYVQQKYDYLVFADGMFGRFFRDPGQYSSEIALYNAFFERFPLVKELDDGGYVVKIYRVPK